MGAEEDIIKSNKATKHQSNKATKQMERMLTLSEVLALPPKEFKRWFLSEARRIAEDVSDGAEVQLYRLKYSGQDNDYLRYI